MAENRLQEFFDEISADLDRTIEFWRKYSNDTDCGGFFNCIGPTGQIYDTTKYVWLQGRQVWTYARLYNEDQKCKQEGLLQEAIQGATFLLKFAKNPDTHRCYLILTRDGKPIKMQRSIFSECFYIMAMAELYRATHTKEYKEEAFFMMEKIIYWIEEDWSEIRLGLPPLEGESRVNSLAVPMMLLCLVDQMYKIEEKLNLSKYDKLAERSVKQILAHVKRNGTRVLENVGLDGSELPGCSGRLMVPGHSMEAGWFLLQYGQKYNLPELVQTAVDKFIVNPFKYGWDQEYGGLFYFLDADGHSPVQLEWNMKLWWTHAEAMIAFLMAYQSTHNPEMLEKFALVYDYCYKKHVERNHGEWYGYLNRDGSVSMNFKGGPWKGVLSSDITAYIERIINIC